MEAAFHDEIWVTFSDFLADGIKVCDQPLPFRHICLRPVAENAQESLWKEVASESHSRRLAAEAPGWRQGAVVLQELCLEGMVSLLFLPEHQEIDHKVLLGNLAQGFF